MLNINKRIIIFLFSCLILTLGISYYFLKTPKVSIVMPVYNGEQYLEQTIGFLLLSNYKDFEFIIIDDGSTDGSYKKLKEIASSDNRIKLFKNEKNMGIVETRNKGMQLAKGEYIAPMDQDDWSLPDRIGTSVKYLDEHPDTDVVDVGTILMKDYLNGIKTERFGVISYLLKDAEFEKNNYTLEEIDENIKLSLLFSLAVPTQSGSMMRKDFLEKNNIKYTKGILYSDDYYLYADMLRNGAKFHHINEVLHIYNDIREHSNNFNLKQFEETQNIKKELFNYVGLNFNDYKDIQNDIKLFACKVINDLLNKEEVELKFSKTLLQKNKELICQNTNLSY